MAASSDKKVLLGLLVAIVLIIAATVVVRMKHRDTSHDYVISTSLKVDGTILTKPRIISDFELTSDHGKPFTKDDLRGHWTLLFFGFTNCPAVCPTTMASLNTMYVALEKQLPRRLLPHVVMISVDPDRDSVKRMHEYVKGFNANFMGVRGSTQETRLVAQQMNVAFAKVKLSNGNYTVNHSPMLLLLDPNGNLRAFLRYSSNNQTMAQNYLTIIRSVHH